MIITLISGLLRPKAKLPQAHLGRRSGDHLHNRAGGEADQQC